MNAVILSAGEGKRLRPLTNTVPKVMLPVAGKPLLEHLILLCKKHGVNQVFLNLYYLPEVIIDHFNNKNLGVKVNWVKMPNLISAAEALLLFKKELRDDFLVLYGDVASNLNLSELAKFHRKKKALATLTVHSPSHFDDSDLLELGKDNRIQRFHKKPHPKLDYKKIYLGNAGTIVFSQKIFKYIETGQDPNESISASLITKIITQSRKVFGYETNDYMKDIGTPERYRMVNEEFVAKL